MRTLLQQVKVVQGFQDLRYAVKACQYETGSHLPLAALRVARKFDEQHLDAGGYILRLDSFHRLIGAIPPALVIITDPQLSAEILRAQEFKALSLDTPPHHAMQLIRGSFILSAFSRKEWHRQRSIANNVYGRYVLDSDRFDQIAKASVDSVLSRGAANNRLPTRWCKYLVGNQLMHHLLGAEIDSPVVYHGIRSHANYLRTSTLPMVICRTPLPLRTWLSDILLRRYHVLQQMMISSAVQHENGNGILANLMRMISGEQHESKEVIGALFAGLSTVPRYLDFSLYQLARHQEFQELARTDEVFLKSFIREVGRNYPVAPYVVRRVVSKLGIYGVNVPSGSLIMFALFAFGGAKYVDKGESFDPFRTDLQRMATRQGGEANIFSYGPRSCLAKHFASLIVQSTLKELLYRFDIYCDNDPIPVLGKVTLVFDRPLSLRLVDRKTGSCKRATSA